MAKSIVVLHSSTMQMYAGMSDKTIAQRIKDAREPSVYMEAARKFNTSYVYVMQIATGRRRAVRGKGAMIKTWLEDKVCVSNGIEQ